MKNSSKVIRIANACFPFLKFCHLLLKHRRRRTSDSYSFSAATATSRNNSKKSRGRSNTKKRTSYSGDSSSFPSSSSCCQPRPPGSDLKRNLLKLDVTNAELSVGGAAAADPLWLAHHPRLPLPQRWQAHQAGLSHHTGQLFLEIIQNLMQCGEKILLLPQPKRKEGHPSQVLASWQLSTIVHWTISL